MIKLLSKYLFFFLLLSNEVCAQKICRCCYDSVKQKRVDILGNRLREAPFNGIVKLFVNSVDFRGTASFISDNMLITASHNLFANTKAKNLYFLISTTEGDSLIKIKKTEYRIELFGDRIGRDIENDIALIVLKDSQKLKGLQISKFRTTNFRYVYNQSIDTIHITGYPCDKEIDANFNEFKKDTLTDKFMINKDSLYFNSDTTIAGFNLCACSGDSGAPVWVSINGIFYIIGIYHGVSNIISFNRIMRVAALLDRRKIDKINELVTQQ
jgi:V8-like Glu-specific endopeptidase